MATAETEAAIGWVWPSRMRSAHGLRLLLLLLPWLHWLLVGDLLLLGGRLLLSSYLLLLLQSLLLHLGSRLRLLLRQRCCLCFLLCSQCRLLFFKLSQPLLLRSLPFFRLFLLLFHDFNFPCLVLCHLFLVALILLLCPRLNFIVLAFNVLVGEVCEDTLATTGNDWTPYCFERVAVDLNILQLFVFAEEVWQLLNVVVEQSKLVQVRHVVKQSRWHFLDLILTQVQCVDARVRLATEFVHACHLVHVQMDLTQVRHVSQDVGDGRQCVTVEVDVGQAGPVNVLLLEALRVEESSEVVLR